MQLYTLPIETTWRTRLSHKITFDYTDLVALGANASAAAAVLPDPDQTGLTVPAGTAVLAGALRLTTAFDFSDAGITSLLVEVGDGGDPNRFIDQTQIAVDGTEIFYAVSSVATFPYVYLAADTIDATFTAANGGTPLLNEATSGAGAIYLGIYDMNRLDVV